MIKKLNHYKYTMNTKKIIQNMRTKCKNKADSDLVDAFERIVKELEKPRKETEYFIPIGPFTEAWDKALSDEIKHQGNLGIMGNIDVDKLTPYGSMKMPSFDECVKRLKK